MSNQITVKHEFNSVLTGRLQYLSDGTLKVTNSSMDTVVPIEYLRELSEAYKGANRIHKPMALLFWQDCKNGKSSNWIEQTNYFN